MTRIIRALMALVLVAAGAAMPRAALAEPPLMGVVVMHGKGGSPAKFVAGLASALADKGYLVANLEMPWSGRRDYDVSVSRAEEEVESALAALRGKGAQKVFVAGHSQGGVFAVYFAGRHSVDGVIAIAPGGDAGSPVFREKLGESVVRARQALVDGKDEEKLRFLDYEGSRGTSPVVTTPAVYLTWFDPEGAMLDRLRVSRCVIAGNSFGGRVAWETALAHPQRIEKLILVDAAGLHADRIAH